MQYMDKIKEERIKRKYSQTKMAEILNTVQVQYWKYETKKQELPIRHLITICKEFNISADYILGLEVK